MSKVNKVFDAYRGESDKTQQQEILTALHHRLAAGQEVCATSGGTDANNPVSKGLDREYGEGGMWQLAKEHFDHLCELDIDRAFEYAVNLTL